MLLSFFALSATWPAADAMRPAAKQGTDRVDSAHHALNIRAVQTIQDLRVFMDGLRALNEDYDRELIPQRAQAVEDAVSGNTPAAPSRSQQPYTMPEPIPSHAATSAASSSTSTWLEQASETLAQRRADYERQRLQEAEAEAARRAADTARHSESAPLSDDARWASYLRRFRELEAEKTLFFRRLQTQRTPGNRDYVRATLTQIDVCQEMERWVRTEFPSATEEFWGTGVELLLAATTTEDRDAMKAMLLAERNPDERPRALGPPRRAAAAAAAAPGTGRAAGPQCRTCSAPVPTGSLAFCSYACYCYDVNIREEAAAAAAEAAAAAVSSDRYPTPERRPRATTRAASGRSPAATDSG